MRIPDDEKGVTAIFEMYPQINHEKSKTAGRPIFDEIELCRIYLAANKQTVGAFPAHAPFGWITEKTDWGEQRSEQTYAMRFQKQYLEFKAGGKQSFSGTLLSELPFLTQAKRFELKALNIHTAEALASLDGTPLKMLGPGGRELKNEAMAYIEKAQKGVASGELASELSKRDAEIDTLKRQIASLVPDGDKPAEIPASEVKPSTVAAFETFEDDDLRAWLKDAGVEVDGRWSRNTMIAKAEEVLATKGKQKQAA